MEEQFGLAEEKQRQGNEAFRENNFTAALELYFSALEITAAHQDPPTPTTGWHKLHFDILSNRLQAVLKLNISTTINEHTNIIKMIVNHEAIESGKQIKALLRCAKYYIYLGDPEEASVCIQLLPNVLTGSNSEVEVWRKEIIEIGLEISREFRFLDRGVAIETRADPCSICIEDIAKDEKIVGYRCKHIFHEHCIIKWLIGVHLTCPICGREVIA